MSKLSDIAFFILMVPSLFGWLFTASLLDNKLKNKNKEEKSGPNNTVKRNMVIMILVTIACGVFYFPNSEAVRHFTTGSDCSVLGWIFFIFLSVGSLLFIGLLIYLLIKNWKQESNI